MRRANSMRPSGRFGAEHGVAWKTETLPALSLRSAESPQEAALAALVRAVVERSGTAARASAALVADEDLQRVAGLLSIGFGGLLPEKKASSV